LINQQWKYLPEELWFSGSFASAQCIPERDELLPIDEQYPSFFDDLSDQKGNHWI